MFCPIDQFNLSHKDACTLTRTSTRYLTPQPVNVHHTDSDGLVAHFSAHTSAPVASLCFDGCGQLLLSACRLGRDFHVYRLLPHPKYPQQTAVHHLYALHRGDTVSQVRYLCFLRISWMKSLRGAIDIPIFSMGNLSAVCT